MHKLRTCAFRLLPSAFCLVILSVLIQGDSPMRLLTTAVAIGILLRCPAIARAQSSLPRLVSLTGVLLPADGGRIEAAETVTFAVYAEETGGAPIWQEAQTLQPA